MQSPEETLLSGFEIHSTEKIEEALAAGIDPNALIEGKTPLTLLVEMYYRSPAFSDCVECLVRAGAQCAEPGLLEVLLDEPKLLNAVLADNPALVQRTVDIRCAFTPLLGASLLHVACEFGLLHSATALLAAGANVDAKAGFDLYGFNGQTPIFHTVCQHRNHCQPVMQLLLQHGAKPDVRLAAITWGKSFEWETTVFDPTPVSFAQAGLLPQFQRSEVDVYENIRLLTSAAGRILPDNLNVPNSYLRT
jgi:ankyrin repeat protein